MIRICILAIAILSSGIGYAQNWQTPYNAALQAYQRDDFSTAIQQAEMAIGLAASDVKGQAYARQIFTASCLETQMFERGLAQVTLEIDNFKGIEPEGENYLEAIKKKGQLQMGLGKLDDASATFHQVVLLQEKLTGKQSYEYYVAQAQEAEALMQAKKYDEAQQAYESTIAGFRAMPDAGEDLLYSLFNSGYIDFTRSNKTQASKKLAELVAFLERNNLQSYPQYEEARRMLSTLNVSGEVKSTGLVLPPDEAKQLFDKAYELQQTNTQEALLQYNACEKVITDHQIVNNTSFSCFLNYSRLLFAVGEFDLSASTLVKADEHAKKLYANNSAEAGHVQILKADLSLDRGDVKTASLLYQQGIRNLKKEKPTVWVKQAQWISEQLIAAKAGEEAILVLVTLLGDATFQAFDVRDKIVLHQLHGRAHFEARQADKLIQYLKPLVQTEKNADVKQTFLLLSAQAENEKGNLQRAHQLLLDGIALAPAGIASGDLYYEAARSYQKLGDYKEAEIQYGKALEHIVRSPSAETVMPLLFNSLATFYIQLGNYGAAEKFFLNLLKDANGSPGFYNAVRQNLAALYQQTGRYPEAKKLLLKTLHADALQGTETPEYAIALQNLAAVYQNMNQLDSAQLLYEKALEIDQKHTGEQSLSFATKLSNLGTVYQEGNNFAGARTMFEKALAIRNKLLPPDHPDYAYSQYTLANLLYRTQKPLEALPLFKSAADFYIAQIHDVFPALSDYERTVFYNRVYEVIAGYQMFLLENIGLEKGLGAELLNFRLQTKALLLNSSLKVRNRILQSGDASLIRDFNVWQHTKEQLAFLFSLTQKEREEHAGLIEEFSRQANALEKSLSLKSEEFATAFLPRDGDWKKVQAALKPGEGALEILRVKLENRDSVVYAALVVKPGLTEPLVVVMPNGNFLEQKGFNNYINSIRYQFVEGVSYNHFWKSLQPMIDDVQTLYFSPDGVYTKINCLTLYDPASKHFVIDRMKILLTSNLQDVVSNHAKTALPPHALLLGFPDYRLDAKKSLDEVHASAQRGTIFTGILQTSIPALPGTQTEVQQIARLLQSKNWNVESRLGKDALEGKIKDSHHITLLHIATHGFFVAPKDEHAKQVFSIDLRDIENNSMLRSGLLLAGAEKNLIEILSGQPKSQIDDGILTAYEVMNLSLDETDLVVLSACETGTGDVKNGEGVYGLQRAFMLAGVRHVVMSLWKVDDAATQMLMSAFYEEWLGGKEKLQAFHDAQEKIKERFPHPYHWGAFVMMGK